MTRSFPPNKKKGKEGGGGSEDICSFPYLTAVSLQPRRPAPLVEGVHLDAPLDGHLDEAHVDRPEKLAVLLERLDQLVVHVLHGEAGEAERELAPARGPGALVGGAQEDELLGPGLAGLRLAKRLEVFFLLEKKSYFASNIFHEGEVRRVFQ